MTVETLPDWYSDTGYDWPRPEGRYFCPIRGMTHLTDAKEIRQRREGEVKRELFADALRAAGGRMRPGDLAKALEPLGLPLHPLAVTAFARHHGGPSITVVDVIERHRSRPVVVLREAA